MNLLRLELTNNGSCLTSKKMKLQPRSPVIQITLVKMKLQLQKRSQLLRRKKNVWLDDDLPPFPRKCLGTLVFQVLIFRLLIYNVQDWPAMTRTRGPKPTSPRRLPVWDWPLCSPTPAHGGYPFPETLIPTTLEREQDSMWTQPLQNGANTTSKQKKSSLFVSAFSYPWKILSLTWCIHFWGFLFPRHRHVSRILR